MAIKDNREYRNVGNFEERSSEEKSFIVEGYASTFDSYEMCEIDGEKYYERIDRHAFDEADMSDVVFLLDHQGRVYARTKNGTITLNIDDRGLHTRTDLSTTQRARDVAEDIEVGNYSQMSFSFIIEEDHFDRQSRTRVIDKIKKVFDISAVGFPANPNTDIGLSARDYFNGEIEMEKAERLESEKREAQIRRIKIMGGL